MRATRSLRRIVLRYLSGIHEKRLGALFDVVDALVEGGRLTLTALGRSMSGPVAPKHNIKKVDRLLGNEHLHDESEVIFRAIAHVLLEGNAHPIVLVDWTKVDDGRHALVAALPTDGRALPIFVEVHPQEKVSDRRVEANFLRALKRVVPEGCKPVITTDAGFRNPWFKSVARLGWNYVGRLSANVLLTTQNGWLPVQDLHKQAGSKARDLGWRTVAKTNPVHARVVIFKERPKGRKHSSAKQNPRASAANHKCQQRARTPWMLVTSHTDAPPQRIVDVYRTRMQVEQSFRDAKNHRFGWSFEDAKSQSCPRLRVLLLLASLGMLALTLVGRCAETMGIHRGYQANTVRDKRVLSVFVLGLQILRRSATGFLSPTGLREALTEVRGLIRAHTLAAVQAHTLAAV